VTVILGDHDLVDMGAARHRRWTASAPTVRLVVVRDAGHAAWIDAPREVTTALEQALVSLPLSCH